MGKVSEVEDHIHKATADEGQSLLNVHDFAAAEAFAQVKAKDDATEILELKKSEATQVARIKEELRKLDASDLALAKKGMPNTTNTTDTTPEPNATTPTPPASTTT